MRVRLVENKTTNGQHGTYATVDRRLTKRMGNRAGREDVGVGVRVGVVECQLKLQSHEFWEYGRGEDFIAIQRRLGDITTCDDDTDVLWA